MRFSFDWLSGARNRRPEERATVAAIKLYLAGTNALASREALTGEKSEALTIALAPLAEGIAKDWWRILGRRDCWHSLLRYRNGYVIPDVSLRFDGRDFEISSRQPTYGAEDLHFPSVSAQSVPRGDVESALAGLVSSVIDRISQAGVRDTPLHTIWSRVTASRSDPEEAAFCEAAGALDLDPYRIEDAQASLIERSGQLFHDEPLIEFLAGMSAPAAPSAPRVPARTADTIVTNLLEVAGNRGPRVTLPEVSKAANDVRAQARRGSGERAYAPGYRVARRLRRLLGTDNGSCPRSVGSFAGLLGNPRFESASQNLGVGALVARENGSVRVHLSDGGALEQDPKFQKFVFARAVGDALCFPKEGNSVINGLHGAERQATNRAFAAQFLAPVDEVLVMREGGSSVPEVAKAFGVAPAVIEHQEENKERIWEACARAA